MNATSTGNHMADMPYLPNDSDDSDDYYYDETAKLKRKSKLLVAVLFYENIEPYTWVEKKWWPKWKERVLENLKLYK